MFALPLIGWTMLSAGGYTISLVGSVHLHPPVGFDSALFALMRRPYTLLCPYPLPNHPDAFRRRPVPCLGQARWRIPEHGALVTLVGSP
jgi:hypothetical protein